MGPTGNRPAPGRVDVRAAVDFGEAVLLPDPARPHGWTLLVDGVPQSYVDLDDPEYLAFGVTRLLERAVRLWSRRRVPGRVLHLGAGALTLARLLDHRFPGVEQVVAERDAALLAFVAEHLPFASDIELEVGDARDALERQDPLGYDLIIADVFAGAATPVHVAEKGFAVAAARALAPGGLYLMNVADVPPLAWTRVQVATLLAAFGEVALIGETPVVKGRRAGNVILPAGNVPMINPGKHETVLSGVDLAEFVGGAKPRLDASG